MNLHFSQYKIAELPQDLYLAICRYASNRKLGSGTRGLLARARKSGTEGRYDNYYIILAFADEAKSWRTLIGWILFEGIKNNNEKYGSFPSIHAYVKNKFRRQGVACEIIKHSLSSNNFEHIGFKNPLYCYNNRMLSVLKKMGFEYAIIAPGYGACP